MENSRASYTPKKYNFRNNLNNNVVNSDLFMTNYKKQSNYLANIKEFKNQNKDKRSKSSNTSFIRQKNEFIINDKIQNENNKDKNYMSKTIEPDNHYRNYKQYSPFVDYNINSNRLRSSLNIKKIHNKTNNVVQYDEQSEQNELILRIFIYIYYYEKTLSEKNIFIKSIENYYLIK